ncbi:phage tail tape measure protein [Faecalibacterium prausnitzii]|nr:phage tail tape measure protein [Faecalibacterium prausnitzii]
MSNVEALSGATGEELTALSDKAKEMGATTKFTAGESADALSYMALAGWDTQSMLDGISPVLNLAAAANMDLAQASDIVTDYLTAFGLKASDTTHFVDVMAYAMANSNTDVIQLGEAYKACAATATSLGYSVEETTAVLATMANAGVKGGEAGTALNAIFTRLATNTKECGDTLAEYGVQIYLQPPHQRGYRQPHRLF